MTKKQYERPIIIKQQSGLMNKFGSSTINNPITEIDGVPIREIVDQFGSPVFTFSESKIRNNQKEMYRIFKTRYPKVQFAWSYKTNYLNAICSIFHQEGSWAEVVSEFEYEKARNLGVQGEHIIFNGPSKTPQGLERAIKENAKIHIDHFDELYLLIELTEKLNLSANVAIRVNMDVGIYPKWDRFGFNYENGEAKQALRRIVMNKKLNLVGLHTHIGTYIMGAEPYRTASLKMVDLANYLYENDKIILDYIDMGGGLPSKNTLKDQYLEAEQILPTYEQYAEAITSPFFDLAVPPDEFPTLIIESGRALIDDTGYLISSVIANKRLSDGRRAVVVDAGVNLMFTSLWFKHRVAPGQHGGSFTENSTLYGPLCMNIDCIREEIVLPALKKGELVVIMNVGSYNVTQWMQFISMRPNIVLITEDRKIELLRETENLEYLSSLERIPEKLKKFALE